MKTYTGLIIGLLLLQFLRADDTGDLENKTEKVVCNQHFMRSYLLKGREFSSKSDRLLFCSNVVHNCCNKADQQRIFHYVKVVLPLRLNEHKDRMKLAFEKLKKLHRHIGRTMNNFVGSDQRKLFCRRQRRTWENYNLEGLSLKFDGFYDTFYERSWSYYQRFYCAACDGWAHSFISKPAREGVWEVQLDQKSCMNYIDLYSSDIELWNVDMLNYLKLLQDVVDCTHYTQSFNLTFYNERVQETANQAVECLKTFGPDRLNVCKPICRKFSISNLIPWADGDSNFLLNTVNFFERFFKNREIGDFISIEMRRYYKRFETLKSLTPVQQNDFVKMIIERTHPRHRKESPLGILNESLQRQAVRGYRDLKQSPGSPQNGPLNLQTRTPEPAVTVPDYTEADFPETIQVFPNGTPGLPQNRRLLQGFDKPTKKSRNVRSPRAETDSDMAKIYDQIFISKAVDPDYVYRNFVQLVNLDLAEIKLGEFDGLRLGKYESTKFNMTEPDFYKKLYEFRQRDKYLPQLEELLADFGKPFNQGIDSCISAYFKIDKFNYQDEAPVSRRLRLVPRSIVKVKSKTIKKS